MMSRPGHQVARLAALAALAAATAGAPPASSAPPTYRRVSGDTFAATETRVSGNGRYVVYVASPRPYGEADPKGFDDSAQVYAVDLVTGRPDLVSVSTRGTGGNHDSRSPSVSADGRYVVFASDADNLVDGDTNGVEDVFLRDRKLRRTTRIDIDVHGRQVGTSNDGSDDCGRPTISADGSTIAFFSRFNLTLEPVWTGAAFSYLYVVPRGGVPARAKLAGKYTDGFVTVFERDANPCGPAALSTSGRYVAASVSRVLRMKPDGGHEDPNQTDPRFGTRLLGGGIFVQDLKTGSKRFLRASPPFLGGSSVPMPAVTMDGAGTKLVYEENYKSAGAASTRRLVLWNLRTGSVEQVDGVQTAVDLPDLPDPGVPGLPGVPDVNGGKYHYPLGDHSFAPMLSGSGRYLVFTLAEYGMDGAHPRQRVVKRDLVTGSVTTVVKCELLPEPLPPDGCGESYAPSISNTGTVVAFVSTANLAADDPDTPSAANLPSGTAPDPYAEKADRVLKPADVYVLR